MIDRLLFDHMFDIVDFPEAFEIFEKIATAIAQVADDPKTELVMRPHPLDDRARQLAIARDQDAIETLARSMAPLDRVSNDPAPEDDEENRAQHEDAERCARVENVGMLRRANPE